MAWIAGQGETPPYKIDFEENEDAKCLVFKIVEIKELPQSWNLLIGDALFNFRCSLDYAAWQMVKAGSEPNPKREQDIYFPIQTDAAKFSRMVIRRLPGVRADHLAIVQKHQPYLWGALSPHHPLAILAELSRYDKHRRIIVVAAKNLQYSAKVKRMVGWTLSRIEGPPQTHPSMVKAGTELFRIYGQPTTIDPNLEVNVDFEGAVTIAFENGRAIMDSLNQIANAVKGILDELEPGILDELEPLLPIV